MSKLGLAVPGNTGAVVTYDGFFDCAKKIYRNEGSLAFFKGLTPAIIRVFPQAGVFFWSYEIILQTFM